MADLGTLALGTFANVSSTAIQGTDPVLEVIASTDDADYVYDATNSTHTGEAQFDLGDTPADLGNVDTLLVRLRYAWQAGSQVNTWDSLRAIVRDSAGAALTNEVTLASTITTTTPTNSSAVAFTLTAAGIAADKTTWDGATVRVLYGVTKVKSGDTIRKSVFAAEVTGTYTVAVASSSATVTATATTTVALAVVRSLNPTATGAATTSVSLAVVRSLGATATGQGITAATLPPDAIHIDYFTVGADTAIEAYGDWVDGYNSSTMDVIAAQDNVQMASTGTTSVAKWNGTGSPTGNQSCEVDVAFGAADPGLCGPGVRIQGTDRTGYFVSVGTGATWLSRYVAGAETNLASGPNPGLGINDVANIKLVALGTSPVQLLVYIDDVLEIDYSDSDAARLTSGLPGIWAWANTASGTSGPYLDNVVITDTTTIYELAPSVAGQATTSATLSLNSMVAATAEGVGTATAAIVAVEGSGTQHELSPTVAGAATTSVSMSVITSQNASAAGVADASVSMSAVRELGDSEAVGAGTASVSLTVASQLSATADGVGSASVSMAVVRALGATESAGIAATTADIVVSGSVELVASPEGEATATATVHVVRSLGADVVGAATVEITVAPLRIRDATAAGEATTAVSINVVRAFAAAPLGEGSAAVSSAAIRELVATATAAGVVTIVLTAVEAVVTPVSGKYARSHARAHQLLVGSNRVALTFTRTAQGAYDPEADSATVTVTTIVGVAVRRKGNPDRYKALGLVESNAPTLFFVPDTYGETPAPGDVTEWASEEYTVRDVERVAPDGVTIGAFVIIEK